MIFTYGNNQQFQFFGFGEDWTGGTLVGGGGDGGVATQYQTLCLTIGISI